MKNHINVSIFRKPTTTDCSIPRDFCHPADKKNRFILDTSPIEYTHTHTHIQRNRQKKTSRYSKASYVTINTSTININNSGKMTKNKEKVTEEEKHRETN
jgi:hypothetical protein